MNIDELIILLGEFGPYQRRLYFMMCLFSTVSALHALNMVFVGAEPKFHCSIANVNLTFLNISMHDKKQLLIPAKSQCYQYDVAEVTSRLLQMEHNITAVRHSQDNMSQVACTDGYEFYKDEFTSTITSDLVCENKYWRSTSRSVFFGGRLLGAIVFGQLSDRFGRRPIFMVGIFTLLLAGSIASFSPNMFVFLPSYFLQGASHTGVFLVAFTLSTELVGPKYRVVAGFVIQIFYGLGYVSLSGLAYFIRQWRYLEMAITLPVVFFGLYWWLLPESIPWLLSRGRDDEVDVILQKAAKRNGVSISPQFKTFLKENSQLKAGDRNHYFIDCLRTRKMALISLNVWFNWLVNSLVFYGISLNSENMSGDPYLNFTLIGAVGILSYVFCILVVNKLGRRSPLIVTMCVAGVACVVAGVLVDKDDNEWRIVMKVCVLIGKFCITSSYAIIYLMGAELFPTVIRNAGMGVASMSARIGGILAPFILDLKYISGPLPLVTFGAVSFFTGLLAVLLPETSHKPLPQTLDDVTSQQSRINNTISNPNRSTQV